MAWRIRGYRWKKEVEVVVAVMEKVVVVVVGRVGICLLIVRVRGWVGRAAASGPPPPH